MTFEIEDFAYYIDSIKSNYSRTKSIIFEIGRIALTMSTTNVGRFSPSPFKYNERVAPVLIPCLIVLSGVAGKAVAGILLAGAMFTYIMDALRWKTASFASVWITLVAANIGFLISIFLKTRK